MQTEGRVGGSRWSAPAASTLESEDPTRALSVMMQRDWDRFSVACPVVLLATVLVVAPVAFILFYADNGYAPLTLVVPTGFVGPIWIVLDPDGQDIPLGLRGYRAAIPANGVLRVRSLKPTKVWHYVQDRFTARYDDGSPLPTHATMPGAVGLHGGGTCKSQKRNGTPIEWMPFFVGTEAQYHEYSEPPRHRMPLPPGSGW